MMTVIILSVMDTIIVVLQSLLNMCQNMFSSAITFSSATPKLDNNKYRSVLANLHFEMQFSYLIGSIAAASLASATISAPFMQEKVMKIEIKDFNANTEAGKILISASRKLEDGSEGDGSGDFLGDYAIKFQNCHSVTQWDSDEGTGGKVLSRRLVRFRLCPLGSCASSTESGCISKYGDFAVDLNTFLYYYISAQQDANEVIDAYCGQECYGSSDYNKCYNKCFSSYGGFVSTASEDGDSYNLDPLDFAQCAAFDNTYYLGPYCSDDGGSVHLGVFSDNTCSTFSSCDATCFYNTYNYTLPYDSTSLVSNNCLSCYESTAQDGYDRSNARYECSEIYENSGKCETKMFIDYPNESACTYIQGLKLLGSDGMIRSKVKKSKEAGLVIGILSFSSLILAAYVHFLYRKFDSVKYHFEMN